MPVSLIAVDIDRTLLDDNRNIPGENREALDRARSSGIGIALCSGRDLPSTLAISEPMGIPCWLVIQNGSLVIDPDGTPVLISPMPGETVRGVLDVLERYSLAPVIYDLYPNARRFWWQIGAQAAPGMLKFRTDHGGEVIEVEDIRAAVTGQVSHLEVYDEADRVLGAVSELESNPNVVAISNMSASMPGNALMGIYPAGASKENALEIVVERLGITAADVLAIGDNLNDVGMVRWAGTGVMMANGPEEARKSADWIAPSNNDNGVARAIERFVKI
jgi:Cof subfamily protein (haloacid dehalogenase superfamily)